MRYVRSSCTALLLVVGCSTNLDEPLKEPPTPSAGTGSTVDAGPDADTTMAGQAAAGTASAGVMAGMMAGTGAAGQGSAGVSGMDDCTPNPDTEDEVCPLICPESCNGEDDDCDLRVDEGDVVLDCADDNTRAACGDGECLVLECLNGYRDCDGDHANGCEVAPEDPDHCGACGVQCSLLNASAQCIDGECAVLTCDMGYGNCSDGVPGCEQSTATLEHCGGCATACDGLANATPQCGAGVCEVDACIGNFGDCNASGLDGCEQELNVLEHCGGCGVPCALGGGLDDCSGGVCLSIGCDAGYADCDGDPSNGCESLNTATDCGACGAVCDAGMLDNVMSASCDNRVCNVECDPGWGDCDADPSNGCETSLDSLVHCGACDSSCTRANAVSDCSTGSCELARCQDGFGDCNGDPSDGCEQTLDTLTHCGGCGTSCSLVSCSGGTCSSESCVAPQADCDGINSDCEVDLSSDLAHCGACGASCSFDTATPHAAIACVASRCELTCEGGFGDCDGDYRNGCETPLTTLTNCGSCGMGCAVANGSASCATGTCQVDSCDPDWDDCDLDGKSCERPLSTTSDCGGCGMSCDLQNAVEACGGSAGSRSCEIATCEQSYYRNCDGMTSTGCEVDSRSDANHCGACDARCTDLPNVAGASCADSNCQITDCDPGYGDCTGGAGCETSLDSLTHCGGCGVACTRANATATCAGGTCALSSCNMGYGDCDGDPDNGCEPLTTLAHCGGCGLPCSVSNGTATCATGSCEIAMCDAGYADCDSDPTNGCERDTMALGACAPDDSCARIVHDGRDYWFCSTPRPWAEARNRCRMQTLGDLATVQTAAEQTFIAANIGADAWVGATDQALEGVWSWVYNGVPFWTGDGSGSGVSGEYVNFVAGEPNGGTGSGCGRVVLGSGGWRDQSCATANHFVCEVNVDLCAMDSAKTDPGQCGCGNPDTDGDSDGFADCNDGCPADPGKIAAGTCGCGVSDADGDGDLTPDCNDGCPSDPAKVMPGSCGCGMPETDRDGDTTPDCIDGCPDDVGKTVPGQCGCGVAETDSDADGTPDCLDACPLDPTSTTS